MTEHHIAAICLDCGDTLIDEGTEVKDSRGVSLAGRLIPGADQALHELKRRGYPLALVADGPADTFRNNLAPHGLYDLFEARAISDEVGACKPDPAMFQHALDRLGIHCEAYGNVVMVGNNLARDVRGANKLGLISVWLSGSPRYAQIPDAPEEQPAYTIRSLWELVPLIEALEEQLMPTSHRQPQTWEHSGGIR
jgi:FMN phosphatase YigB (HAD superfamily)